MRCWRPSPPTPATTRSVSAPSAIPAWRPPRRSPTRRCSGSAGQACAPQARAGDDSPSSQWARECASEIRAHGRAAMAWPSNAWRSDFSTDRSSTSPRTARDFADKMAAAANACARESGREAVLFGGAPFAGVARELAGRVEVPIFDGLTSAVHDAMQAPLLSDGSEPLVELGRAQGDLRPVQRARPPHPRPFESTGLVRPRACGRSPPKASMRTHRSKIVTASISAGAPRIRALDCLLMGDERRRRFTPPILEN